MSLAFVCAEDDNDGPERHNTSFAMVRCPRCGKHAVGGYWCELDGCGCRCRGRYHGAAKGAQVEPVPDRLPTGGKWWVRCGHAGWHPQAVRSQSPINRSSRDADRIYRDAVASNEPASEIAKTKGGWVVRWDSITTGRLASPRGDWPAREAALLSRVVLNLLRARRADVGSFAPCEYFSVYPLRDLDEACVLWHIITECWSGNPCGAVRAIEVLEGRPDPARLGHNVERGYPDRLADGFPEMERFLRTPR